MEGVAELDVAFHFVGGCAGQRATIKLAVAGDDTNSIAIEASKATYSRSTPMSHNESSNKETEDEPRLAYFEERALIDQQPNHSPNFICSVRLARNDRQQCLLENSHRITIAHKANLCSQRTVRGCDSRRQRPGVCRQIAQEGPATSNRHPSNNDVYLI